MKAQVKVSSSTIIDVEAGKQKDLFKGIASAHEVFGEKRCGLCGCESITPVWRTVTVVKGKKTDFFEFPEWHCNGLVEVKEDGNTFKRRCGARLALGTINDDTGTLFPQRRLIFKEDDKSKEFGRQPSKEEKDNGIMGEYSRGQGWTRYKGEQKDEK